MRPLTLKIAGLRSYRSEQEIHFSDGGLMAVIGDTGAGKSSILEAIFFALYGGCTWDRRAVVPLISDGVAMMQVELTFVAEGRRWKVFRAASRSGAGGRHELTCLDDPGVRFDNADPVTAQIRRLVGLDDEAFLRTVILPQGRFQALLQASRADRTAILKGIFRLDQLAAVREVADAAARRLRPGVSEVREERARMLPDPQAALEEAETRRAEADQRRQTLQALAARITAWEKEREETRARVGVLGRLVEQVEALHLADAPGELRGLAERWEAITTARQEVDGDRVRIGGQVGELQAVLEEADAGGVGVGGLAAAASTLDSLTTQLSGLVGEQEACEAEADHIGERQKELVAEQAAARELDDKAVATGTGVEAAALALTEASTGLEEGRRRLLAARQGREEANKVATHAAEVAAGLEPAATAVAVAEQDQATADAAQQAAETELAAIQRAHAVAHAAEGTQPGDPCPICRRELPGDFVAPTAPGDESARARLKESNAAVKRAQEKVAQAKAHLTTLETAARQAQQAEGEAQVAADQAFASLHEVLPDADLSQDDDQVLHPLAVLAATTRTEHEAATKEEAAVKEALVEAKATLASHTTELERRSADLEKRRRAVAERHEHCEAVVATLPADYRPTLPLESANLAAVAERVARRRAELADVEAQLTTLREELRSAGEEHERLTQQLQDDVERPAGQLDRQLTALAQRLGDLMGHLHAGPVPAHPEGTVSDLAEWAATLIAAVDTTLSSARSTLVQLDGHADDLARSVAGALGDHDLAGRDELDAAQVQAAAELQRAGEDGHTARDQIPRVAALEAMITKAGELLAALDELTRLMADGKFIGYMVAHKQQTLLAVTSEILGSMTGGRYGFSETFEIIDRLTGLPRGVKTLSGGETFMASLSLALGLVELAGRGGGRLDALFLDEGFGSLDANSLTEALDALTRQAEGGRLVVVISHLRSVAEAMEHIVAITRGPEGSRITPLGGTTRDQMVAEEIEAGLLS